MSKKEFPALPDLGDSHKFTIAQKDLKNLLYRVAFAVSREDNRYVLTGVYMSIMNAIATFVGTDGKRLARTHQKIEIDSSVKGGYIIPLKAVEEILKNLGEEGDATIYLMSDKIAVEANKSTIITKLLSGEYPDIARVIPESVGFGVNLHREELITLLRQVSLFTSESSQAVRFTFADGELKLSAMAMEIGEGKVSMPVNYTGEKFDIAFNPEYFLAILRHCSHETVTLGLTDAFNPGIITENGSEESYIQKSPLFVIMPLRLSEE
jgi:DNA polymerase-3 subunit beta